MKLPTLGICALAFVVPATSTAAPNTSGQGRPAHASGIDYVPAPPNEPPQAHGAGGPILYVNGSGATYYGGTNNAVNNTSSIVNGTATIPPFQGSADEFEYVFQCVRYQFARYNIQVVKSDPSPQGHIEASVGGLPAAIGRSGIWGVAPWRCSGYSNAVVFNFSEATGNQGDQLCETIAHEAGHALGLEHQMLCEDPMTYLTGCGFKTFQNTYSYCGESSERNCNCGSSQQNADLHLRQVAGSASDTIKPTINVNSPGDGAFVVYGFAVDLDITDNKAMSNVRVYLDGTLWKERRWAPYRFVTPQSLSLGEHMIRVEAEDAFGNTQTREINVFLTPDGNPPECDTNADCPSEEPICHNLQCWPETVVPKDIGEACVAQEECESNLCASLGNEGYCTEVCSDSSSCPDGLDCIPAGGTTICWPANGGGGDGGGGGCTVDDGAGRGATLVLLGLLVALAVTRRRR